VKASRKRRAIFAVITLSLSILLSLSAAEIVVRLFGLSPGLENITKSVFRLTSNPILRYEMVPFSHGSDQAINAEGRRDFHYRERKPPSTFRISVIGDSIAYGGYVRIWESFPKLMEQLLNEQQAESDLAFEVWNYSVRGYGVLEEVETIRAKVLRTDPDLIILAYCLNDPDPFSIDLTGLYQKVQWKDERFLDELRSGWQRNPIRRFLYRNSRLFLFLKYRYLALVQDASRERPNLTDLARQRSFYDQNKPHQLNQYFHKIHKKYWHQVHGAFETLAGLVEGRGIPVVLIVFPDFYYIEGSYPFAYIHEKVLNEGQKFGFKGYDLTGVYTEAARMWADQKLHKDPLHPSEFGHKVAALEVTRRIIEDQLLPKDAEEFNPEIFDLAYAGEPWDHTWFESFDMFHVEMGLALASRDKKQALWHFRKALELNQENDLAEELMRDLDD